MPSSSPCSTPLSPTAWEARHAAIPTMATPTSLPTNPSARPSPRTAAPPRALALSWRPVVSLLWYASLARNSTYPAHPGTHGRAHGPNRAHAHAPPDAAHTHARRTHARTPHTHTPHTRTRTGALLHDAQALFDPKLTPNPAPTPNQALFYTMLTPFLAFFGSFAAFIYPVCRTGLEP